MKLWPRVLRFVAGLSILDVVALPFWLVLRILGWLTVRRLTAIVVGAILGTAWFSLFILSPLRPIVRDAVVVVVADKLSGAPRPLTMCDAQFAGGREDCDLVYSRSAPFNPATQWGLVTNSPYLTEMAVNIIPVFVTDNMVSIPEIPTNIYFQPLITADSFHLGGKTDCASYVMANERYITVSAWNDERDILVTVTHELLHNQDGNFCSSPVPLPEGCVIVNEAGRRYYSCEQDAVPVLNEWIANRSIWVESHTSSGTVEALAAQCSAGSGLACASFWDNVKGMASGSLRTELNGIGLGGLYDPFLDLFVRSRTESRQADKSMRDYTINGPEGYKQRMEIIAKYYAMPWNVYVVPGIANGALLDTGNLTRVMIPGGEKIYLVMLGMPYDDSQLMFGPVGRMFLRAMTIGSLPGSFSVGGELPSQIPELLDGRLLFPINSLDKVASH